MMEHSHQLETFSSVKAQTTSHKEALETYKQQLSSTYSLEKAQHAAPKEVVEIMWITYRTEGVKFTRLNFLLILAGVVSVTEKLNYHPFTTYHAISGKGQLGRNVLAGLVEAAASITGLAALCMIITGIAGFVFDGMSSTWRVGLIVAGIVFIFASRIIASLAKRAKIPKGIFKDKTSPFVLYSLKRVST